MLRLLRLTLILAGAAALCVIELPPAQTQSTLRKITNTTEEAININPSVSGDGHVAAFESTEDLAGAGGSDHFRAIRANISNDPATFLQMGGSRAVAPAISQDGSHIAFASKDDPLGSNIDGNSEIFLSDGTKLIQITNTLPGDVANRVGNGNFQPSISDDGRFIAFSSNRDLAAQNSDSNLEIFIYDSVAASFTQLTNSSGMVGFSDAKISGDGTKVAYIRDSGTNASPRRDLLIQNGTSGPVATIANQVQSLQMTYGRAISDDGARVVYSGETATNSSQVFVYDGRSGGVTRQITSLGARVTEVPLHPTISGDGLRIAFAARRSVPGAPSNSDGSVELYLFDTPTSQFSKITNVASGATPDVVSSMNDDGSIIVFNFPRVLSDPLARADTANNSEIYATGTPVRPSFGTLSAILNGASFGNEASPLKAIAPGSIAIARGRTLAHTTEQPQRLPNGTLPTNVGGTRVLVNGRAAQIFFVSPGQVNFLVPPQTEIEMAEVVVTNADNFSSRGTVTILRAAPGIFTGAGDGTGQGIILNGDTLQESPFDPTGGNLRLTIFVTGARNATQTAVNIGGRIVKPDSVIASPDLPGLDEIHVRVPVDLRGTGTVNLSVQCDGRDSSTVTVAFSGDPGRNVLINEVLADPPDGLAGDANYDGVRDGTQDEFIELVNGTSNDLISLGGWTIRTRTTSGSTETTRFTFASGTSLPAGEAIVVFGGGNANFNPNGSAFGCSQVLKASTSSGLSLTNAGLTIVIRDGSGNLITQFSYGGSTGLEGDNNQSLTRSPDNIGTFVPHTAARGAGGRRFSPGLKLDGTPFGSCPRSLTSVAIAPPSASIDVGQTTQFTARAFDQFHLQIAGVPIDFTSDNPTVATIDSVSIDSGSGIATAKVIAHNPGTAHITASGTEGSITVNSGQSLLTVNGPALVINDISQNEGNASVTTFTFTVSLSAPAPTGGVTFNIATQDGTATVADSDYVARSLIEQTIPAGRQTYTFDVPVNGDLVIEPNETLFVNVTKVTGATINDGQGLGTIVNDDSPVLSIDDVSANEGNAGETTFTFTVTSTLPAPAGGITFDIATADATATAASGDYVARSLTDQTIPFSQTAYTFNVAVNGDTLVEPDEFFFVNISNVSGAGVSDGQGAGKIQNDDTPLVVISQVYGAGGNSGATFKNDYIEIFNRGVATVDLAGWSVQQTSATGASWSITPLCSSGNCFLNPGKYFLVKEVSSGTIGTDLPAADATGTSNLGAASGKIALANNTTALTGSGCPFGASIVDFIGYGTTADCSENSTHAPAPGTTTADVRRAGGCVDTNDNALDFLAGSPNPRNSASPANDCSNPKPDLSINNISVTEGDTGSKTVDFTVTLSAISTQIVTVDYATADGTAATGLDYQSASGTISFAPGQTSKTITISIIGDSLDEPTETFFVSLSNAGNGIILDNEGLGTISDNDPAPSLSIDDAMVAEGDSGTTPANFKVTLSAPSSFTVTVNFATADNTGTAGVDYQATNGVLTFNPGETSKSVSVFVNGDTGFEQDETFFVNLSSPTSATTLDSQGQGTITNDDPSPAIPTLAINDVNVAEGNSGTLIASFDVTLSPASTDPVTVDYATTDGIATIAGNDYKLSNGMLTFAPGDTSKPIMVTIIGDTLVEPDETFFVSLSNASGAVIISDNHGLGTIQNDDTANLVISQVYGGGNNSGAPLRNDFIELFNRGNTTVDLAITPYSVQYASVGSNFGASKTNLTAGTIAPGQYFLIQESGGSSNGVALPTPDATGSINLAATSGKVALVAGTAALPTSTCPGDDGFAPFNANHVLVADFAGYGGSAATSGHCYEGADPAAAPSNTAADIRRAGGCTDTGDNAADFFASGPFPRNTGSPPNNCVPDAPPNLTISDVTVVEGNSAMTTATFLVTLSAPAASTDVMFDIATQNSTATTANSDYVAKTLTSQVIPAGQTSYTFSVTISGDTAIEPDETFFVNLTNVSGAILLDSQGVGKIQNDDLPTLTIDDISSSEGDTGTKTLTFHISLSAAAPAPISFDIATQDDTATAADNDYIARSLTAQTITAGNQNYTFGVTVNGDTAIEANEMFFVNVTNVSGAIVLDGLGVGTIQNDDSPVLSIDDVAATEGDGGTTTLTFHVSLSLPAGAGGVTFDIATADGTATTAGDDYVARNLTLQTIPAGSSSCAFDVTVNGDSLVESTETFLVNVTNVSGATVLDGQGQGTIQNDDTPQLVISQVYGGGGNSSATYTNDFVEIFNRGTTTIDFSVTTYSVQYAGATSNFGAPNTKTDITSGQIAPGHFFLIQETSSGTIGSPLPTVDASGNTNLSATAGKIALVAGTTTLGTLTCPGDDGVSPFNPNVAAIADFLGYGSTANCYEGTGPPTVSGTNSNARSIIRALVCIDTNVNSADFSNPTSAPAARNSATTVVSCP